ncbi:MAG: PEGA domain-containing protein [Spirochaetes bacterium]|nr:PEGA domain-containing protein [Spirochaetota bacterium]
MKKYIMYIIYIILLLFLFSCTTSRGSLYTDIVKQEKSAKGQSGTKETKGKENSSSEAEKSGKRGLKIVTNPDNAELFIDNKYMGTTPILIEDMETGNYRLIIRKEGYYSKAVSIDYKGGLLIYTTDLKRITGYLFIKVTPSEASIELDGQLLSEGMHELPVGRYSLDIRLFGYNDYTKELQVNENEVFNINAALEKAKFHISGLASSRDVFNPANPGLTGNVKLSFKVTSWGTGNIKIYNSSDTVVFNKEFKSFSSWNQHLMWKGRDIKGKPLPDGTYRVVLTGKSKDSSVTETETISITIDSSVMIGYRTLWNGTSGLLYSPTAAILPFGDLQISFILTGHLEPVDEVPVFTAPADLSMRFGIGREYELNILGSLILGNTDNIPMGASISLKRRIVRLRSPLSFNAGLFIKASYQEGTTTDRFANSTGISAGIPLQLSAGFFNLVYSPGIILAPFPVIYPDDKNITGTAGLFSWLYQQAGILLDFGSLTAGISASLRSAPFTAFKFADLPLQAGAEINWMLPGTRLFLSFIAAGEFESIQNFYLFSGGGISFVY